MDVIVDVIQFLQTELKQNTMRKLKQKQTTNQPRYQNLSHRAQRDDNWRTNKCFVAILFFSVFKICYVSNTVLQWYLGLSFLSYSTKP